MKPIKLPFFSNQALKAVKVTPQMITDFGDYPKVTTIVISDDGKVTAQEVPVEYHVNEYDEVTAILVTTSNKNGFILIG